MKTENLTTKREDEALSTGLRLCLASTHHSRSPAARHAYEHEAGRKASTSLADKSDAVTISD